MYTWIYCLTRRHISEHVLFHSSSSHTGAIDVSYMAVAGNLTELPVATSLATPGEDFLSALSIVRLEDGQQSTVITAPILDVRLEESL